MRDFKNYHKTPIIKDKIIKDGSIIFEKQLHESAEGYDVNINGIDTRAVIRMSGNPYSDFKEEREISCKHELRIKRGDYVYVNGETWIITSDIDNYHIYDSGKIKKTNHIIRFMNKNKICEYKAIIENQNKYTLGVLEKSTITIGNGRYSIVVPLNDNTITIKRNSRFIFNNTAWEVADVDIITQKGLVNIMLGETQINPKTDDVENEIADRWNDKNEPEEAPDNENSYRIIGKDTIRKYNTNTYKIEKIVDGEVVEFKCDMYVAESEFINDGSISIIEKTSTYIKVKNNSCTDGEIMIGANVDKISVATTTVKLTK